MMGRMDLELRTCPECKGSGKDPRKRKRLCPRCGGTGKAEYCTSCCEFMPCRGTEPVFDQTYCSKPRNMHEKATKAFHQRLKEQTDPKNRPSLRQVTRVEDCHACGKPAMAVGEDGSFTCGSHECDRVGVLYTPFVLVGEQPMKTVTEIRIEDGKLKADGVEVKGVVEEVVLATANLDGIKNLELTSCTCAEACEKCGYCSHCCGCSNEVDYEDREVMVHFGIISGLKKEGKL